MISTTVKSYLYTINLLDSKIRNSIQNSTLTLTLKDNNCFIDLLFLHTKLRNTTGRSNLCKLLKPSLNQYLLDTRMRSSRMRTVHCNGRLSCHACPLPCMPPATYAPLPCMPSLPAMHTSPRQTELE